eukprot:COSAG06_NODE_3509_length_5256_cov_6.771379_5_plen_149_part_00
MLCASVVDPTTDLRIQREAINNYFKKEMTDADGNPCAAEDPRHEYAALMKRVQDKKSSPPNVQTGFTLSLAVNGEPAATERWLLTLAFASPESLATHLAIESAVDPGRPLPDFEGTMLYTAELKLVPWAMACARVARNGEPCDPVTGP